MQNALEIGAMMRGEINDHFIAPGAALLALSYAAMYVEKSVDGFFALDIAPFTLVGAYLWVLYAIFWRGKKKQG